MTSHPSNSQPLPLYSFGSNGSGQLGLSHDEDISLPERCIFSQSQSQQQNQAKITISTIAAGGNHTLLLLSDGTVYAAGENCDGRCGSYGEDSGNGRGFRRVVMRTRMRRGSSMSGAGADVGSERTDENEDENKDEIKLFKGISATWEASFLVNSAGCGIRSGSGSERDEAANRSTRGNEKGDRILVLGSGSKGELGLGANVTRSSEPGSQIPDFPPGNQQVVSIASGMAHVVAILDDGSVWGWGASRKGQLGGEYVGEKTVWSPKRITLPAGFGATDVVCGREFTVLCGDRKKGEILILGAGAGAGSASKSLNDKWGIQSNIPSAEMIRGYRKVHAAWHGLYIHQLDGTVLSWGRNDRGQLPPVGLQGVKVRDLTVGSEHGLALLEDGSVVAFGWGEHGNCGPETDEAGDVKGVECKRIPVPEGVRVVGLGAGCATSWIVAE